ncbi:MAG: cadherin domain-containing protein, partial [Moraxellaceae bacterium]|nr:cadherin domain-containing protein [Moraxellaceae bacterium]
APSDFDGNNLYEVTVQVSDGSNTDTQALSISVTDVDEFDVGAVTDSNAAANSVAENAANGSTVGVTASATDADATNNTITWSLTDNAGGRFAINASTGVVTVADGSLLDYESATSHSITVLATSADGSTSSQSFTINVANTNDNAPVITSNGGGASASISVAENSTAVTTVTSTDADAGATATYSIIGGADAALFTIDASTGALSFIGAPDREAPSDFDGNNLYEVTVQVSDGSNTDTQALSISVTDVDEFDVGAVTDSNAAANSVAELASNGSTVGITASATDADASNNTITYSLSDNAGGRFSIDASTGVVTVANAALLDYETATSHNITVVATSSDGSSASQVFTININDVDEFNVGAVTDVDASGNSVAEGATTGTAVGITASASDADGSNNTITYTLTNDAGGRFAIDASTGVVTVADGSLLDRETAAFHGITVQATSADGSTSSQTFFIVITDVDESDVGPVTDSNAAANTVGENAANGSTVGVTASATDADATNNTISYSLTDNAGGRFSIDTNTGVVTVADGSLLDRESNASHDIVARATSSDGSFSEQTFTIALSDTNDNPPVITSNGGGASAAISVAENSTAVTTVVSSDADAGATATYSIVGGADSALFTIDASTGVLTFIGAPDREAPSDADGNNLYEVTIQVSDGSNTDTQALSISVTDVDEFDVGSITDSNAAANTVAENAANGTAVGITASASDADATNNAIAWSLIDNAGGRFSINASTGVVTVADGSLLDFESANSHSITVRATSADGSFSDEVFIISVADTNEGAIGSLSDSDASANAVAENAANGTTVGVTALATDPDGSDTVSYSLTDNAGGRFSIDAGTGVITVADGSLLDRESASSHVVTVRALSSDGSFTSQNFTINLTDVNDSSVGPVTDSNAAANSVAENAANGSSVGITASATDPDASNNTVTYSLTDNAGGRFAINASTGVVTVADGSLLDYESATSHGITVLATSADGSTSSQSFTINVANTNDNAPVITSNGGGTNANTSVGENSGTVTTVTATDADLPAQTLTYSIVGGADASAFVINAASGALYFASAPNFEAPADSNGDNVYEVQVRVSDGAGGTDTQTLLVQVLNINEQPGLALPGAQSGNSAALIPIVGVQAGDEDGNLASVSLTTAHGNLFVGTSGGASISGNGTTSLMLSGSQAQINAALATLAFQGDTSFAGRTAIDLIATDSGGLSRAGEVLVNVLAVEEPPDITPPPVVDPEPPVVTPPPTNNGGGGGSGGGNGGDGGFEIDLPPPEGGDRDETDPGEVGSTALDPLAPGNNQPLYRNNVAGLVNTGDGDPFGLLLDSVRQLDANNVRTGSNSLDFDSAGNRGFELEGRLQIEIPAGDNGAAEEDIFLDLSPTAAGQAATALVAATVVWWAGRSIGLLAALMASVPAWRTIDPLPILARSRGQRNDEFAADEDEPQDARDRLPDPPQPERVLIMDNQY